MWRQNDLNSIRGLSQIEVEENLKRFGYNELPNSEKRTLQRIILEVIKEPMFLLLVACGSLYLILGDFQEAIMLLGFVIIIIAITVHQERKSERALEALRDLSSPRALVIRESIPKRIPGREVVVGDMVILCEGDRVPADALVISCTNLSVDESLLTGESVPVRKTCSDIVPSSCTPGGDDLPFVYSGTLVVQGQAISKVLYTGLNTEIGKIGKALQSVEEEDTNIQKETRKLVKNLAIVGAILCSLIILGYGIIRQDWFHGILAGLTLAMATLPEEFPVVLTVFLALGAWRISQKNVLTRRIPAIETLGATTVLCVDKTGTITQNIMSVAKIFSKNEFWDVQQHKDQQELPEVFHEVMEFGILASQKAPFDPMEKALRQLGSQYLKSTEHWHEDWTLVQEYPLSKKLLAVSHVWQSPAGNEYIIAAKGAPEAIADLCHLPQDKTLEITQKTSYMAQEGLRVLGVARSCFERTALPIEQHDFTFEFIGLIGLHDPIRPCVPDAIQECYRAGIRVVMITGDYPITAQNIAKKINLKNIDQIITGPELEKMPENELQEKMRHVNIFARVVPEQKLRIVNGFKSIGEIAAMTGDGVNDAPSLKSAHIGIAMGGRGTDVARESSSLVLLEDDFSSIVQAVKMGRRIFDNLQKAMAYILAVHIPIAGISMLPIFCREYPLILLPMHVVFLELVIDPSCSVVFEAEVEEKNTMTRPPRNPQQSLFGFSQIMTSIFQGIAVLVMTFVVFYLASCYNPYHDKAMAEAYIRSCTFTTLIFSNLCLILVNRSFLKSAWKMIKTPNIALWWVILGAISFLMIVLHVPFLQEIFKVVPLNLFELFFCASAAVMSVLWFEIYKFLKRS